MAGIDDLGRLLPHGWTMTARETDDRTPVQVELHGEFGPVGRAMRTADGWEFLLEDENAAKGVRDKAAVLGLAVGIGMTPVAAGCAFRVGTTAPQRPDPSALPEPPETYPVEIRADSQGRLVVDLLAPPPHTSWPEILDEARRALASGGKGSPQPDDVRPIVCDDTMSGLRVSPVPESARTLAKRLLVERQVPAREIARQVADQLRESWRVLQPGSVDHLPLPRADALGGELRDAVQTAIGEAMAGRIAADPSWGAVYEYLAGVASFAQGDFPGATEHWRAVLRGGSRWQSQAAQLQWETAARLAILVAQASVAMMANDASARWLGKWRTAVVQAQRFAMLDDVESAEIQEVGKVWVRATDPITIGASAAPAGRSRDHLQRLAALRIYQGTLPSLAPERLHLTDEEARSHLEMLAAP